MPEGIKYQILLADREGCPPIAGYVFTDPAAAAAEAKRLAKQLGEKLIVKPIVDHRWRDREMRRVKDGTYRELPWSYEDWWSADSTHAIWKDHFPHPSIERPGWLAYTKSPEDGTKDKQTILRPGAYLKKYFERPMHLHGRSERSLVSLFMMAYGPIDIKFASTEADIVSVYDNGPDTCMKGKRWPQNVNPARIYAHGDLQVAYMGELDDASARVLVWPEKKIFSRVYGDIARITQGLERLGYKWGAPIGARLTKIKVKDTTFDPRRGPPTGCFIAPYIDKKNMKGGGHLSVIEKDDHLVICEDGTPGSHHCGLPDGYSSVYVPRQDEFPTFTCDHCAGPGHKALKNVFVDPEGTLEESWCTVCIRTNAYRCGYSSELFSNEVDNTVVGGNIWNSRYAEMYAEECEMTHELYPSQYLTELTFSDGSTKRVCSDWIEERGGCFTSDFTGRVYQKRELVRVSAHGGRGLASKSELKYHAFQCDGCDGHQSIGERMQTLDDDRLFCSVCHDRIRYDRVTPASPSRKQFDLMRKQQTAATCHAADVAF